MPTVLAVPAAIDEADIAVYAALKGKHNSLPIVLAGNLHEPHTVRFETFAGSLQGEKYVGVYRFELDGCLGDDGADLNQLPGLIREDHQDGV